MGGGGSRSAVRGQRWGGGGVGQLQCQGIRCAHH